MQGRSRNSYSRYSRHGCRSSEGCAAHAHADSHSRYSRYGDRRSKGCPAYSYSHSDPLAYSYSHTGSYAGSSYPHTNSCSHFPSRASPDARPGNGDWASEGSRGAYPHQPRKRVWGYL